MNESLFFIHILLVVGYALLALKGGKETLIAWIALQAVLANLFVLKQMFFFGFNITCSDIFAIGSILGLNFLQEFYGKAAAKQALWICFFAMGFFVIMSQIHLLYAPSDYDISNHAYQTLFSPSPRLLLTSIGCFLIVQSVDLYVFGALRTRCTRLPLFLRNGLSLTFSQLLDTALFTYIGLAGLVSHLFDIFLVSFLVKLLIIALSSPVISIAKKWVRRSYDRI